MPKTYCVATKGKRGQAGNCVIIKFQVLPKITNLVHKQTQMAKMELGAIPEEPCCPAKQGAEAQTPS